jgi:fibronectin type 3 domain-containing protein
MDKRIFPLPGIVFVCLLAVLFACSQEGGGEGGGSSAPAKLIATGTSKSTIKLEWTSVSGAARYKIYYSVTSTGVYRWVDDTEDRSYIVSDLVPAATFYYKVSSVGLDGIEGPKSDYAAASTYDESGKPIIPDPGDDEPADPLPNVPPSDGNRPAKPAFTYGGSTASTIFMEWTPVSGAAGYNVYRSSLATGTYTKLNSSLLTITRYEDKGLSLGVSYYYKVAAVNSHGEGDMSDHMRSTTVSPP